MESAILDGVKARDREKGEELYTACGGCWTFLRTAVPLESAWLQPRPKISPRRKKSSVLEKIRGRTLFALTLLLLITHYISTLHLTGRRQRAPKAGRFLQMAARPCLVLRRFCCQLVTLLSILVHALHPLLAPPGFYCCSVRSSRTSLCTFRTTLATYRRTLSNLDLSRIASTSLFDTTIQPSQHGFYQP